MIDFKMLKPNIIYRHKTKYRLPTEVKRPTHGSMYMVVTKSMQDTARFFKRPMFMVRLLTRYYHDRLFNYRIYNLLVKFRIKDTDLRERFATNVKSQIPEVSIALNKDSLMGRNYIHDISQLNEKFFSIKHTRVGMRRVDEYFRLFKMFTADAVDTSKYTNRVMFIPLDEWVDNPKDIRLYTIRSLDNFLSLFYHKLKADPEYFRTNFAGWKFYFIYHHQLVYIKPDEFDEDSADEFKKLMLKIRPVKLDQVAPATTQKEELVSSEQDDETEEDKVAANEAKNKTKIHDKIEEKLSSANLEVDDDAVQEIVDRTIDENEIDISADEIAEDIDKLISQKQLELEQMQLTSEQVVPRSRQRLAREQRLVEEMKNLQLDEMTLGEIQARADANKIDKVNIPIDVLNPNLKEMTFPNFDNAYLENLYKYDIVKMMTDLQYKDRPLYLIESSVKDVSDELNDLEEYTFKFEDEAGRRHTFSVNLPKFTNGRFMKISGNKKIMSNQIIPLPIMKTAPKTVQVATNYRKTFIHRFGQNVSPKMSVLFKGISGLSNKDIKVHSGSSVKGNRQFITTVEYDELAGKYRTITLPNITFFFDQSAIRERMEKIGKAAPEATSNQLPIAITNKNEILYMNTDNSMVEGTDMRLVDYITSEIAKYEPKFGELFKTIKPGRRYEYSRSEIMRRRVPLGLLLSYLIGLITLMKKANIKYRIISKEESKRTPPIKKGEEEIIEFQNAWLIYDVYPLRNTLLLGGFIEVPTEIYDIEQFLTKDVYYEIFENLFGRSNIGHAFENFQQLLIDPITEDVLRDHGLPTEFVDVMIYANSLLEDNNYVDAGDMNHHRVRSNEMISAFLYKALAEAYENYRRTADNPNPIRLSTKKDSVIIEMLTSQVTSDYSNLNPLLTIEALRGTTFKGPAGMNQDRAYSLPKRAYHPSMVGVLSQASPISGTIGIARTLTVDANVVSGRGYIKTSNTLDEVKSLPSTKLLSGSEAAIPFGPTSDDPERTAMMTAQSKHTIACVGSDRSLVETGFEKALPHLIGDTFVFKAKKDGVVTKIDKNINAMIVKYDDESHDIVDLNPEMGKNSGGGFYISNSLIPSVEEGATIKAGELLAYNPEFFTKDKRTGDPVFMAGPLARIAIRYSSKVFEDSTVISERLSRKMSSYIVTKRDVALGKNSNIDYIVKKGQEIKVNDPLIVFDTSHDDELTNKILSQIGDDSTQDLIEASKTPILSRHNGTIEDIKIYYTVDKDELSESARKIIESYEKDNEKRIREVIKNTGLKREDVKINLTDVMQVTPDSTGKVKGVKVGDGILIEFHIKYLDKMGVGDKLTSFIATKAIVCDIFEEGKEPYLLSDPEDKVDAYIGAISVGARMVHSIVKIMQINAIIVGMKKNIKNMYEEIYGEKIE